MFRPMRRFRQQLPQEECIRILETAESGVLAVAGDDDYPYAVPMNYWYHDGKIYFHGAKQGHKLDAVLRNDKVSFCVIGQQQVVSEKYATSYQSVIAFGRIRILTDDEAKWQIIDRLAHRFAPDDTKENREAAIRLEWKPLCMMEMTIEHMTGKEDLERMKQRNASRPG